jgi:UDP-2,3-diacylglucosamine pyrophosphatase LpxH
MHERLLEALLSVADVRLVAALRHDQLGLPSGKDLRIFIPDFHLVSAERRKAYQYGTNHEELLVRVVRELTGIKQRAAADEAVEVYHIGDLLDLWREASSPDEMDEVPARIKDDHEDVIAALRDRRLKAHFMLGNHDFDLYRWPDYAAWDRRYYIPWKTPGVMVVHGDYFDWVERLPERVKSIFVYLFAPAPTDYKLGEMRKLVREFHAGRDYSGHLQLAKPAAIGTMQSAELSIPPEWNVQKEGMFLDSGAQETRKANQQFHLNLKTIIIGHTHHARIAVQDAPDGSRFTLVDTGAWIEECQAEGDASPAPNAQITAMSGNEVRIYQLTPK